MNQDLWTIVLQKSMATCPSWQDVQALLLSHPQFGDIFHQEMSRTRWDALLLDKGKVILDRLAVICGWPRLRAKALRYVTGKSKFSYKGIVYHLNTHRPEKITSMTIYVNPLLEIRWSSKHAPQGYATNCWGCSMKRRTGTANSKPTSLSITNLERGLWFLGKLKLLPAALLEECQHHFTLMRSMNVSARPDDYVWSTKHTNRFEIQYKTMMCDDYRNIHEHYTNDYDGIYFRIFTHIVQLTPTS